MNIFNNPNNLYYALIICSFIMYIYFSSHFDYPETFEIKDIYLPKSGSPFNSLCPRIVYQVLPSLKKVPAGLYNTIMHNINMNPEFEFRFYTYETAEKVLKELFNKDVVDAYNATNLNKIKSDYLKLAFISKFGGIFIDISQILCFKLEFAVRLNNVLYINNFNTNTMDLDFLSSHPNNMGIENAFAEATKHLLTRNYCYDELEITGGRLLSNELFYLGYLLEYSLLTKENDVTKIKSTHFLFCKKYKSFDKENALFGLLPDISLDWDEKIIYNPY